jgi:hypothetical protein
VPVFFDYNGDSLPDIIVGNLFYYNAAAEGFSQLGLLRNTGTRTQPKFTEVTDDYAGLSAYHLFAISPAFGDLDGDGKPDMLVGNDSGHLYFFKNTGDTLAAYPVMTSSHYFNLHVNGGYSIPFIYDVNNDGLPDLVVGNGNGTLSYFWNFGTASQPKFSADSADTTFGGITVTAAPPGATVGNSQPFLMRDSPGRLLLFAGAANGAVFEYAVDTLHLRNGNFTLIDSNFLKRSVGFNATMQACDLNGDGKPEYLAGNARGGLQLFSETVWDSSVILANAHVEPAPQTITIFPNPADASFKCRLDAEPGFMQAALYNMMGQKVEIPYIVNANNMQFNSTSLSSGIYLLHIATVSKVYSARVVVAHGR